MSHPRQLLPLFALLLLPSLAHACPSGPTLLLLPFMVTPLLLFAVSGVAFALYDGVIALRGLPLGRTLAVGQAAIFFVHATLSFCWAATEVGSAQLLSAGYSLFSALAFLHAVSEARASSRGGI